MVCPGILFLLATMARQVEPRAVTRSSAAYSTVGDHLPCGVSGAVAAAGATAVVAVCALPGSGEPAKTIDDKRQMTTGARQVPATFMTAPRSEIEVRRFALPPGQTSFRPFEPATEHFASISFPSSRRTAQRELVDEIVSGHGVGDEAVECFDELRIQLNGVAFSARQLHKTVRFGIL